ncbi:MAG: hypothetical protein Q4C23_01330 [Mycoplasmatota bacterium]|nr:hypothetical protein [Mycoplasmatota bacterium]
MKKCYNCKGINRDTDTYCRNCGLIIKSNTYYIFINIGTILSFLGFIFIIALFIASYYV